jgi:genome maintenance exonuclease 1
MVNLMQLIPIRKKFRYPKLQRVDSPEGRRYVLDEASKGLPSVTTILSGTKDQTFLKEWEERVGKEEADRIRNDAATVGTHMHNVVERLLLNRSLDPPRTWLQVKGYRMGYTLIEHFFQEVQEVWGAEVPLYYPDRYAGTTDCVAVYKGSPSILDFKQANRMKKRDWIEDYFIQLAAYAMAHNKVHGTEIMHGVILMVAQNGEVQEFVTCGREFLQYQDQWMQRVEEFEKKGPTNSQTVDPQTPFTSEGKSG